MHTHSLVDISQAGLKLAIQEIKEEMFDTPQCDYTIAKYKDWLYQRFSLDELNERLLRRYRSWEDVDAPRTERFAQADLAGPLGDGHQHDVHDDDTGNDQSQGDHADQHGEDPGRRLVVDTQDRVGREDAEVVVLRGL